MASLVAGTGATLLVGPEPPSLASTAASDTGDPALAARVHEVFGQEPGYGAVAVAVVEADGSVTHAGVGDSGDPDRPTVDESTRFEVGPVTMALTGMLVAEQVRRGETSLDERLEGATLEELAVHRSGLPRQPRRGLVADAVTWLSGGDPYAGDAEQVLAAARAEEPEGGAEPEFSNLGAAAAGDLVAAQVGAGYPELLADRVLEPLGMTQTAVVADEAELPTPRARGTSASGHDREPWIASGWAPAGVGTWSTTSDLARVVSAVASGEAPGADAAAPRVAYLDGQEIGLFWITSSEGGREVTWHNGGTGGFRSWMGFEPATGRGVVVLATTDLPVDDGALELLLQEPS